MQGVCIRIERIISGKNVRHARRNPKVFVLIIIIIVCSLKGDRERPGIPGTGSKFSLI